MFDLKGIVFDLGTFSKVIDLYKCRRNNRRKVNGLIDGREKPLSINIEKKLFFRLMTEFFHINIFSRVVDKSYNNVDKIITKK